MTISRGALRAMIAAYFCILAVIYLFAWSRPAIGMAQEDALHLVTAKAIASGHGYYVESLPQPIAETRYPPLFPAIVGLASLASSNSLWLKLLPLLFAAGWLWLTRKLLLKMGASWLASLLLVAVAAACPLVIFLGTNLLPQTLFGLLAMACLLELLEERALLAGLFAGLATLTQISGVALIVACILTLAARRRFRGAAVFALVAMIVSAPWFGWSLAHVAHDRAFAHRPITVFTDLAAADKVIVFSHNLFDLVAAPLAILTGYTNSLTVSVTVIALIWCLILRRQMVPDLFLFFYSIALTVIVGTPEHYVVPILPLVFWIVWRAARRISKREPIAAIILILVAILVGRDVARFVRNRDSGSFPPQEMAIDSWGDLQKIYGYIRTNSAADSVVLANMDSLAFLNTGRKSLRGFEANDFEIYYSPRHSPVAPDQLSRSIAETNVGYVVLAPDRGLPESPTFHQSVEALEHGGVLEPVAIPGLAPGYQLFRVIPH